MNYKKLIVLFIHNQERFIKKSLPLLQQFENDVLLIDDGSTDDTCTAVLEYPWMKYIKHAENLGYGASFITAYKYALDMEYDVMIFLDHLNIRYAEEVSQLMENITYGYDIVNSSRILENYDHQRIPQYTIDMTSELSGIINEITGFDLTDPLSGIKAIRLLSIKDMELNDFSHGLCFQLWIQAHYFGLSILEIPALSGNGFGEELSLYEDPLAAFMPVINTEKYLYSKKSIN